MLGGGAIKVARFGHGALRWYNGGRGQCVVQVASPAGGKVVAAMVQQQGFVVGSWRREMVEPLCRSLDRVRSSFGPSRIEPSRQFCSSCACFQPWLFGRLRWIEK
ncbi:hypothetical protein L3X38_001936 [Prunus dulcis]|uniref:Uncharacterized protein n=1 Tax=Prunus dulcis TaxID=3755 RepID=A0AAD4WT18_PRUDU|nr:hypothetical protein L3X38_001936 [Prunus dulcis]